jgi:hypothetical protein
MFVMRSDIESISEFVIERLQLRNVDLSESARQILISKAIGIWHKQGLRMMREQIEWEVSLLPAMNRANDRTIVVCAVRDLRNRAKLTGYLSQIRCQLQQKDGIYFIIVPKAYAITDVKAKLKAILKGQV